ncbi:hypothetical protein ACWF82_24310 [Nocardia sp. NPDC055053]
MQFIKAAQQDWRRIEVDVLGSGADFDVKYSILKEDGSVGIGDIPTQAMRAFSDMRHLRYEEDGTGTWFSMRMFLDPPDFMNAIYNSWVDPIWEPPIPPEAYAEDLRYFPRTEQNIPRWLKQKLNPDVPLPPVTPGDPEPGVDQIEAQIKIAFPSGTTYAQVHFSEIGNHREISGLIQDITGRMIPWTPPSEVADRFSEYRAATRSRPAVWFSARIEVWYDGAHKFNMFGPTEPKWTTPPSADDYRQEVQLAELYNVSLPDWVASR